MHSRDFEGAKDFAILIQEAEPLLEGSDQILALADVLLSAEKRIKIQHDRYLILQLEHQSDDEWASTPHGLTCVGHRFLASSYPHASSGFISAGPGPRKGMIGEDERGGLAGVTPVIGAQV